MRFDTFHFLRPLWLLCIPAALWLVWIWQRHTDQRRQWAGIIAPHLLDHLIIGAKQGFRLRPMHMITVAVILAGIAAAGPVWEREPPPFTEDKAPMVVAIDLSRTMDAVDVPPTRLERAKQKVRDLAALRSGSRTGLVVYAGTAHLVLPPTEDPALLEIFLAALETDLMPVAGRNAVAALALADRLLEKESAAGTVLFITDAFDDAQIPLLSEHQRKSRDQILALAVGTSQGGPIRSQNGRVALDARGVPVQARFDRETFTRMSSEADMPVMSVTLDEADVEWVQRKALHYLQVVNERTAEVRWKEFGYYGTFPLVLLAALWFRRGWTVRWMGVIALAILMGVTGPGYANAQEASSTKSEAPNLNEIPNHANEIPNHKSQISNRGLEFGAWILELVESWFLTLDQQGRWYFDQGDYSTAAERFNDPMWKGLAYYRSGDYATALTQFARLDTPEAFFLMGNCYARMKEFPAAVGAYDHALKGRPAFREAIQNRTLVASLIPKKSHDDQGEADPNLDPDDIKFDKKGKRGKYGAVPQVKVKPEQMAELWMRNLKVSPADFLREKFRVQAEELKRPQDRL
ncbi:MAG: VWA domain-containing protein [Nitrospira sp.]|nr:VWA domain-containing protein [Nitrospira sp.]